VLGRTVRVAVCVLNQTNSRRRAAGWTRLARRLLRMIGPAILNNFGFFLGEPSSLFFGVAQGFDSRETMLRFVASTAGTDARISHDLFHNERHRLCAEQNQKARVTPTLP
jgi:hypothetical protein